MSEINKQHYDWFNKLPMERVDSSTYQRTCACGETVWYETDGLKVKSWILRHFKHSEEVKAQEPFKYDWSIPWKFSFFGFEAFLAEHNLGRQVVNNRERIIFGDNGGNIYVFNIVMKTRNPNFPAENHWVTFNPKESKINEK